MKWMVAGLLVAFAAMAWACGDDTACHTESGCESSHGSGSGGEGGGDDGTGGGD